MIVRTRNSGQIELRAFALTDTLRYGYDGLRNFRNTVSEDSARGLPALHRAARLRAEALGTLELCCYSGDGPDRMERDQVWQSQLFHREANEYQTRFGFWETVGESLAWRGNSYIWKNVDPVLGRITDWYALHPDQVVCNDPGRYTVTVTQTTIDPVGRGPAKYAVDETTILHIRGHGQGGHYEAPSPIEVFREAMAPPVLRQRHEARMWGRGTSLQLAAIFPPGVRRDEVEQWKEMWKRTYEGADGSTTAVIGGGATLQPIGMTAADALFVEMSRLTVEDAARIMAVPANLLGVQLQRAVPNLEQDLATWLRFGLGPELSRIESALEADEQLFGGAHTYPRFETDEFVRGDVQTEATVLVSLVQAGILTPNEARRVRGLEDLPGTVGDIPQITPVGGKPNPLLNQPAPAVNGNGDGSGDY